MIHLTQGLLEKMGIDKNSNLTMLACIIASITGALAMRYVIERPALRLRDKVLDRWKSAPAPITAELKDN